MLTESQPAEDYSAQNAGNLTDASLRQRESRLKSMKDLVGTLAHSFNNALAPLAGYITLLHEDQPAARRELYLKKLEDSLHTAERAIATLLQATHPERHYVPKPADLTALVQRCTDEWMKSLPESARISVEVHLAPCTVLLDEAQWRELMWHLLRNAEGAFEGGGGIVRINLTEELLPATKAAELGLTAERAYRLTVEDNGSGMSAETLERAFDPLYSTRGYRRLAGLGLTQVHSVVRLHGGQIELASSEQSGTTVTIWLPAE